jgi:2,4-dienoyl-CoA reductase-like NADH-dependent reductase (Old Yellow Enzyme family)
MTKESKLFTPIKIRKLELKNRVAVSPMCQYSAVDGVPSSWHMVHLGSRAVGGAGLIMVEASAVAPNGRISPSDTGIWNETQAAAFKPIIEFMEYHGAVAGIQLAHAGRKAGTAEPWNGGGPIKESWDVIAPSSIAFKDGYALPREMTVREIDQIVANFTAAASNALFAGFQVVEVHMAHGYLLHEFLSPLTNLRTDQFGGSFENRIRLPLAVAKGVRDVWPKDLPVFVRVSASDWASNGWDIEQTVLFGSELKKVGVDLIDVSSGGLTADAVIPVSPGYQVSFSRAIKSRVGIVTAAVGLITDAHQAEEILIKDEADLIMIGREFLRDPYFPMKAAKELGSNIAWPKQYLRAKQ